MVKYIKQYKVLVILLFTLALVGTDRSSFISSGEISTQPTGEIKVVTTLSIISDWAAQIGGQLFSPVSIVSGAEDPHTYRLLPGEIEMIGNSDLFVIFGLSGLEPWVQSVKASFPSLNILTLASEDMMEIDPVTGDANPHVWMSPIIAKMFVDNITSAVIALDFEHKTQYESNRDAYLSELDDLITRIEGEYFDQINGLEVVVHHPSFLYLLELLGVERLGVIEEHEGSEPSAQHIQEIVDMMIIENVSTIITQPQIEERLISQIARDTEAKLAKLTPLLGVNNIESYIGMIEYDIYALQHPEEVSDERWIIPAVIIGSSLFAVTTAILAYFKFKK